MSNQPLSLKNIHKEKYLLSDWWLKKWVGSADTMDSTAVMDTAVALAAAALY
jgi:hypothetical protein